MAELIPAETTSECCSAQTQQTCCEPADKAACCETSAAGDACGCSAGQNALAADDLRETVRQRYAAAATGAVEAAGCGCSAHDAFTDPDMSLVDRHGTEVFGRSLYGQEGEAAPKAAIEASLGCGVPTAVADLHHGETVLDLGSGAGADALISARRVGRAGTAIGLDMTDEMLELARATAREEGVDNVEFVKGYIEDIPLADDSVDVVISNCVINLSADKGKCCAKLRECCDPAGALPSPT